MEETKQDFVSWDLLADNCSVSMGFNEGWLILTCTSQFLNQDF